MRPLFRQLQQHYHYVLVLAAIALAGVGGVALRDRAIANPPKISSAITVADSQAVSALAVHLKKVGAKMYGAYWCPYCTDQKKMFGATAFRNIDYVECDPKGENARPALCKAASIKGYPTWEIKGKRYTGVQSLQQLAKASNYKGTSNF